MSKERLEEIRNFSSSPFEERIKLTKESAERVQELKQWVFETKPYIKSLEQQNKRYREVINNINEKAMLYGVDEQVYEAIKEAIKAVEVNNESR